MAKILVVDDSLTQATVIAQLLLSHNHTVVVETSGQQGLSRALQQDFDLIISDLNLPDLTGLEICRRYKAGGRTAPTLLVSSEDQLHQINPAAQDGVDYFCTKDRSSLEPRVEMILLRQRHNRIRNYGYSQCNN